MVTQWLVVAMCLTEVEIAISWPIADLAEMLKTRGFFASKRVRFEDQTEMCNFLREDRERAARSWLYVDFYW